MSEKEFVEELKKYIKEKLPKDENNNEKYEVESYKNLICNVIIVENDRNKKHNGDLTYVIFTGDDKNEVDNDKKQDFQLNPSDPNSPKSRGSGDIFQTDLLITKKQGIPLVAIEVKLAKKSDNNASGFSTHDILVYSSKAQKHKEIYPYLRYGLVVGGVDAIYEKFFIHNTGFDFAFALKETNNTNNTDWTELINIIKSQIKNAELILDIFKTIKSKNQMGKSEIKSFNTEITTCSIRL